MTNLAELFAAMTQEGLRIAERQKLERQWAEDRARIAAMFATKTDEDMRQLWDAYDGCNAPNGFAGEDIHAELNRRGYGDYCAV